MALWWSGECTANFWHWCDGYGFDVTAIYHLLPFICACKIFAADQGDLFNYKHSPNTNSFKTALIYCILATDATINCLNGVFRIQTLFKMLHFRRSLGKLHAPKRVEIEAHIQMTITSLIIWFYAIIIAALSRSISDPPAASSFCCLELLHRCRFNGKHYILVIQRLQLK